MLTGNCFTPTGNFTQIPLWQAGALLLVRYLTRSICRAILNGEAKGRARASGDDGDGSGPTLRLCPAAVRDSRRGGPQPAPFGAFQLVNGRPSITRPLSFGLITSRQRHRRAIYRGYPFKSTAITSEKGSWTKDLK